MVVRSKSQNTPAPAPTPEPTPVVASEPKIVVRELAPTVAFKRAGASQPSPLLDTVKTALANVGKPYGVAIKADYPQSTIMRHLTDAAKALDLARQGLRIRTSSHKDDADWPHVAFSVVAVTVKPAPAATPETTQAPATS